MTTDYFEAVDLPLDMKEELCLELLDEFGARRVSKHGDELKHCCVMPWHNDNKPSASLNFEKLVYGCWSCGSSGGFLWFIAAARGINGGEAREWLETRSGLSGEHFSLDKLLQVLDAVFEQKAYRGSNAIPTYSEAVLKPWEGMVHPWLTDPFDPLDQTWGRGIPVENCERLRIGYDDERQGIVVPHFWRGKLTGWQLRHLLPSGIKYESTEEFPRQATLYNYDAIKDLPDIGLVESPMSVARHLHHLPIAASFGTELTDRQIEILGRHRSVTLWMDNDPGGWGSVEGYTSDEGNAFVGAAERLERYSTVKVVESDWHADPAQLDDDEAERLYSGAVPYAVWERPTGALRCLRCRERHGGKCEGSE